MLNPNQEPLATNPVFGHANHWHCFSQMEAGRQQLTAAGAPAGAAAASAWAAGGPSDDEPTTAQGGGQQQSVPAGDHSQAEILTDGVDESAAERQAAMDMVDRANAGQPVLSGPDPLGLERSEPQQQQHQQHQDGRTDEGSSTAQEKKSEGQPQARGQDHDRWATSAYDPDDETDMSWEHGRRYCGDYFMPNDEDEQDRLRILHQIHLSILNLELTTVPLEDPAAVLDVGTGTGEWAMAMAERWPRCAVTGVDLSPTFERAAPPNCRFAVVDADPRRRPWPWPDDSFDMVHFRHMSGAFADWPRVYAEALRCLRPGGWVEVLEFHEGDGEGGGGFFSPHDRLPPAHAEAARAIDEAARLHGVGHMEPGVLEAGGLSCCEVREHVVPLDPSGDDGSPLGKLWLVTLRAGLESRALRLLTRDRGWDAATVRAACEAAGRRMVAAATDPLRNGGFQIRLRVATARKPLMPGAEGGGSPGSQTG